MSAAVAAFLLSFVVIAHLWLTQHRMFTPVVATSPALVQTLVFWALTIVALPFPTAIAAGPGASGQRASKLLYVGVMALSSLTLSAMRIIIERTPRLRDRESDAQELERSYATSIVFVIVILVMIAWPAGGYWPMVLLILSGQLADAAGRIRRRRLQRVG